MKISLHNELPAEAQLQQLAVSAEADAGELAYDALCRSGRVIAAYDRDQLIGLGRILPAETGEPSFQCTLLPDYRGREIETYMRRLLTARSRH